MIAALCCRPECEDANPAAAVVMVADVRAQRGSSPNAFSSIYVKIGSLTPLGTFCKGFIPSYSNSSGFGSVLFLRDAFILPH